MRILDVGGGTGVHAEWLLADGHQVHLYSRCRRPSPPVVVDFGENVPTESECRLVVGDDPEEFEPLISLRRRCCGRDGEASPPLRLCP